MKLILVIATGIMLLICLPILRQFADANATYLGTITGTEEWMTMVFTMLPILIPIGIVVMMFIFVVKNKKRED